MKLSENIEFTFGSTGILTIMDADAQGSLCGSDKINF